MVYLTRKEHFNAAHKLYNNDWSKEKNEAMFGPCANENWHGHNYDLFVTVKGEPSNDTGFFINVKDLSKIIKKEVVDQLDHKNLNIEVSWLEGEMVTTENIAKGIWRQIEPHLNTCELHCVKLQETENIFVEYFGD